MKQILFFLSICFAIASCTSTDESYSVEATNPVILDKDDYQRSGSRPPYYRLYIYDGKESYWAYTNNQFYLSCEKGDTLQGVIITKTIYEKDE